MTVGFLLFASVSDLPSHFEEIPRRISPSEAHEWEEMWSWKFLYLTYEDHPNSQQPESKIHPLSRIETVVSQIRDI